LTFEVRGSVYALPIATVLEVAALERICCVPGVSMRRGGVVNLHGDAVPVVSPDLLLNIAQSEDVGVEEEDNAALTTSHVLVVSDKDGQSALLGVPIDRVVGLVDGKETPTSGRGLVIERRPVDGRVVSVLDPGQLVTRAAEVIQQSAH
jgi:chemotaxis signal transduction protein